MPAAPVEVSSIPDPLHVSPTPPSVRQPSVERPIYLGPAALSEDINPVVRPPDDAPNFDPRVHVSPVAPPVEQPALESWLVPTIEASSAAAAEPVEADLPNVVESPLTPAVADQLAPESALAPAVEQTVVETRPANTFETAPTEFAASETPIGSVDEAAPVDAAPAEGVAANYFPTNEAPVAQLAPELQPSETPTPSSPESVIAEGEIQDQAVTIARPFPAPRSFTSSGSEMPVVISAPSTRFRDSIGQGSKLFDLGREFLPRAQAWSRKSLRATPRTLVIGAPLVALLGIWAIRSLISHPKHTTVAEANPQLAAEIAAATPAPRATTNASAATAASPILVSTSAAPAAAPPAADARELASAVSHGLPALEALAQKFPSDPQVGIALASQQAQAQRFEAAVQSLEHVIAADPKSAQNGKVMGILWRAAQSSASDASFLALRKLGAKGADIAFDLATTAGVRESVRERAKGELSKSLSPDASEDTRVASELLLASDCEARKALLPRAEREGGKRTQIMLEQFSRGNACTSTTDKACNACLTGSPALAHALAQVSLGSQK
ncbi:MAG TPA: hypothetical protein VER12_21305 [Polyangiaceae bacterium]|nr:hypothetical protein [Polyangiaceae bacterium]